jgi:sortase A
MPDTALADAAAPDAPQPRRSGSGTTTGDKIRLVLRGIGQTLITGGLVVLLFVVYEVWITNVFSARANNQLADKIKHEWSVSDDPLLPLPNGNDPTIKVGSGIANLYLPRLGRDYHFAIVEGVSQDDLATGPGHYPGTALPGDVGNFAVAGHRVGKGEPFLNIDHLRAGDAVIVETKTWWYVYRVKGHPEGTDPQTAVDTDGIPGREIVDPSQGRVLQPVPDHPGARPTERLMTMTTCHPKFTAAQRMIVYSAFQQKVRRTGDTMPTSVSALYTQAGT